jgi:hypothetical protein
MTDEQLNDLRERNAKRLQQAIEKMGKTWLMHPDNKVHRKTPMPKYKKR